LLLFLDLPLPPPVVTSANLFNVKTVLYLNLSYSLDFLILSLSFSFSLLPFLSSLLPIT
jgi:hypothetical protein